MVRGVGGASIPKEGVSCKRFVQGGGGCVNAQTGSMSNTLFEEGAASLASDIQASQNPIPVCQNEVIKNEVECMNVRSVSQISEVCKQNLVPPSAGADNNKSRCATISSFADVLNNTKEHRTEKIKLRIHTTVRGKFEIAKGSPVSKPKMKNQSKSSASKISKGINFSTNEKAANIVSTNSSDLISHTTPSRITLSVGKITPIKRKFPEGGRGEVKSLVNIFERGVSKPTWGEQSESPAKKQRYSHGMGTN